MYARVMTRPLCVSERKFGEFWREKVGYLAEK